ncbi:MAG: CDP-diacylglycerol--serine O-phosphatidyltransferase [Sulfitobacter sp.]|jgi:CDP-diacylglycerol--serine O-phosphatidyltransferase
MDKMHPPETRAAATARAPKKPAKPVHLRHILPSMVTTFAICAGLTSVRMSIEGHFATALGLIVLAAFLDALDGKMARYLDAATRFGAELDTLADFFNFGIAPGLLLYCALFLNTEFANLGWFACLVLALCCALRLARFNLGLNDSDTPAKYFTGVPAPALACLALMPAFLRQLGWFDMTQHGVIVSLYVVAVGGLAISTVPTLSIKHLRISRAFVPWVFIGAAMMVISIVTYPWQTLCLGNILYLASIPFCVLHSKRTAG